MLHDVLANWHAATGMPPACCNRSLAPVGPSEHEGLFEPCGTADVRPRVMFMLVRLLPVFRWDSEQGQWSGVCAAVDSGKQQLDLQGAEGAQVWSHAGLQRKVVAPAYWGSLIEAGRYPGARDLSPASGGQEPSREA